MLLFFSECKKYEDASIPIISYCAVTKEKLLTTAKILKRKMNLVNTAMKDTEVRSDQTCAEMIDRNNKILNEVMNQSESDKQKIVAKRSVDCSEQEKLKIDFQMHMIKSVRQVLNKSFYDVISKLKSKYFFGSVLQFMELITDPY